MLRRYKKIAEIAEVHEWKIYKG